MNTPPQGGNNPTAPGVSGQGQIMTEYEKKAVRLFMGRWEKKLLPYKNKHRNDRGQARLACDMFNELQFLIAANDLIEEPRPAYPGQEKK